MSHSRLLALGLLLLTFLTAGLHAGVEFQSTPVPEPAGWRIEWKTIPGQQYQLQRSTDLLAWQDVFAAPVTATGQTFLFHDNFQPAQKRIYWRVIRLGVPTEPVTVSDPAAALRGGSGWAQLGVITGGTEPVQSVVFFNGTQPLGNAAPGPGNSWTLRLPHESDSPQILDIKARVTTTEGTVVDTPVTRMLLADPSKFIPLGTAGRLLYGQYIAVDALNRLAAFVFYPEGAGDPASTTGVRFEFPAGAQIETINTEPGIKFNAAKFFGGHPDRTPDSISGGPRRLEINHVSPAAVASLLGTNAANGVPVQWGVATLKWMSGELNPAGWSALQAVLPIGDFLLPQDRLNVRVTTDAEHDAPYLSVSYHGPWSPLPGRASFRIPAGDPLKIYLSLDGTFSASGTVEADFPNGATAKGSIAWRDPVFEIRFQGRGIVIPALNSLKRALPANPAASVPATPNEAAMDNAALTLESFRTAYRNLALGGSAESSMTSGTPVAPLSAPAETAGSGLTAWAARLASWPSDRPGQKLDAQMLTELTALTADAGKTGEAAHDLRTALTLLRDISLVQTFAPAVAGATPQATAFLTALPGHRARLTASAKRIISGAKLTASTGLAEASQILQQVQPPPPVTAGLSPRDNPPLDIEELADQMVTLADPAAYSSRGITQGDFNGADNGLLQSHSLDELLEFLAVIDTDLDVLIRAGTATSIDDTPDLFPLAEALDQMETWLIVRHEELCEAAVNSGDVAALTAALRQRLQIFERYESLGRPVPSTDTLFTPPVSELALALQDPFARQLITISPEARLDILRTQTDLLKNLDRRIDDPVLTEYLDGAWFQLSEANNKIFDALTGGGDGDELESALTDLGYRLKNLPATDEGLMALPVTGKFESTTATTMLQLNQAGRYLSGHIEWSPGGGERTNPSIGTTARHEIEGILTKDGTASVEFAWVRRVPGSTEPVAHGLLRAANENGRLRITLEQRNSPATEVFVQTSAIPACSDEVIASFPGRGGLVVKSMEQAPLHSSQLRKILESIPVIRAAVEEFLKHPPLAAENLPVISTVNNKIRSLKRDVISKSQVPQMMLIYQQVFSKVRPAGSTRTYWENLLVMFSSRGDQMPDFQDLLGGQPATTNGSGAFTYTITVKVEGVEGDIKLVTAGGGLMKVHVAKTGPSGSESFDLIGLVGQGSGGPELKKKLPGGGNAPRDDNDGRFHLPVDKLEVDETFVIKTTVDYRKEDLIGFVSGMGGEVSFGITIPFPIDPNVNQGFEIKYAPVSASGIILWGSGLLPPLALAKEVELLPSAPELEHKFEKVEFEGGFEATVSGMVGYLDDEGDAVAELPGVVPVRFRPRQEAAVDSAIFFDVDQATIRPNGMQFLRRLASEHAGVLSGPNARVRILGMTDTTQTDSYNADLSRRRAESVRTALLEMSGYLLQPANTTMPPGRILALGLGELAARNGVTPASIPALNVPGPDGGGTLNTTEPWLAKFIERRRTLLGTIPDGAPAPEWRSVVVLLNNTIVMELNEEEQP